MTGVRRERAGVGREGGGGGGGGGRGEGREGEEQGKRRGRERDRWGKRRQTEEGEGGRGRGELKEDEEEKRWGEETVRKESREMGERKAGSEVFLGTTPSAAVPCPKPPDLSGSLQ